MALLDEKRGKFFDEYESATASERDARMHCNLADYVAHSRKLDFYRDRLSEFDAGDKYPLKKVPVLEPKLVREQLPPSSRGLVVGGGEDYTVFQSGGTTGLAKTSLFSHDELEELNLPNARGFYAMGLERGDRVADLWASGSLYMTFIHINRMLQQYGCVNFPFANHTDSRFIHSVARQFKINCVTGVASCVLDLIRALSDYGTDGLEIKKVYYGAEHFYESDRREIKEKLGVELIGAPGYGTVDTWYLGYQCVDCPLGVFHAHDDQVFLEIVDEEAGGHCEPGNIGMLYVTAFHRRLTPIVRYRVGDRAKWIGADCPCGRTTPLFKLLGQRR